MSIMYDKFKGDDLEFYEQFVLGWTKEERNRFIKEHPDFLKDYPVNPIKDERYELLEDEVYRGIMRKIKLHNC